MSTTDTAAARPDLSSSSWERRVIVAVAEARGATWSRFGPSACGRGGPGWVLRGSDDDGWFYRYDDGTESSTLPEVLTDPGAWGATMEQEGIAAEPEYDGATLIGWRTRARRASDGSPIPLDWHRATRLGEAVALAVLAKHSHPDLPRLLAERSGTAGRYGS